MKLSPDCVYIARHPVDGNEAPFEDYQRLAHKALDDLDLGLPDTGDLALKPNATVLYRPEKRIIVHPGFLAGMIESLTGRGIDPARIIVGDGQSGESPGEGHTWKIAGYDAIGERGAVLMPYNDTPVRDVVVDGGRAIGVVARHSPSGGSVTIAAKATILATGGLTRLYGRNSASANMGGDGHAVALRAGARLVDMEFVQFFPIGHLAPRLIGMDPIMWDPFRYKLGGRLLNGEGREFTQDYGVAEDGRYRATRDVATYAILKEVEAGRGSPHGGAYLSFEHVPEADLRHAFGPVIDRLAANDIDLTRRPIEVAPIAHYHMGGVMVDERMETEVPGLYAAGEVVGGPSGANRLSGNGVTEAFVFGERAGRFAGERVGPGPPAWKAAAAVSALARLDPGTAASNSNGGGATALIAELQALMDRDVGPFRTEAKLAHGLARIREIRESLPEIRPEPASGLDPALADWFDLDNMSLIAEAITTAALARRESRGAHQREDFPESDPDWTRNQWLRLEAGGLRLDRAPLRPEVA